MFGNTTTKRFLINWGIVLLVFLIGTVAAFSYNSITGDINLGEGLTILGSFFGGLLSFVAIIVLVLAIVLLFLGIAYLMKKDYTGKQRLFVAHLIISVLIIGTLIIIGVKWINIPTDSLGPSVVALAVVLGITAIASALVTTRVSRPTN